MAHFTIRYGRVRDLDDVIARLLAGIVWLSSLIPASPALAAPVLIPPADAAVLVPFTQPQHEWGPGHRGVDYATAAGAVVRAAASGRVKFAGSVAGHLAVTLSHDGGYETTYSSLGDLSVRKGDTVEQGTTIGYSDRAHPGGLSGLHFGVKLDGVYVDPQTLLGPVEVSGAIRLAPVVWRPPGQMPEAFRSAFADAGTGEPLCRPGLPLSGAPPTAPNDNIAVAVAGISSSTEGGLHADMYEHGPEELGYQPDEVYSFSYAGSNGPGLHRPYRASHTFGDISAAAERLRRMLMKIARRHPGRRVDLIAHSMGGLVARRFLASAAEQPGGLPQIEHLVTFATPHQGASIASLPEDLEDKTLTGGLLLAGASAWADRGGPIPDPRSEAVSQLQPGSAFLTDLADESVVYGTRVLALGIPNDLVVTADRARWDRATSRIVPPEGLQGHSAIVASDRAQGLAYGFLRNAPASCETGWDLWGPRIGSGVGLLEEQSYRGLAALEQATLGRVLRVGQTVDRFVEGRLGRVARKVAGKVVHRAAVEAFSHR